MSKPQLFSGARGTIEIKGQDGVVQTLAFVTDVSISSNESLRPSYVIGDINPKTIEPLSEDASASIGRIIPINDPKGAKRTSINAIDYKIEPILHQIMTSDSLEITIYDQNLTGDPTGKSPKVMGSLKGARYAGKSFNSSATDLATERYNFVGLWDGSYGNAQVGGNVNYALGSDAPTKTS